VVIHKKYREENMAEVVDFEPEAEEMEQRPSRPFKQKGRGHRAHMDEAERYGGRGGVFETIEQDEGAGPARCE
jgi:hypothetical protein